MRFYQYFIIDNDTCGEDWEYGKLADYSNLYTDEDECRKAAQERVNELNEEFSEDFEEEFDSTRFQYDIHELEVIEK